MTTTTRSMMLIACVLCAPCVMGVGACRRHSISTLRNDDARRVSLSEFAQPKAPESDLPAGPGRAGRKGRKNPDVGRSQADTPIVWFDDLEQREVLHPVRPGQIVIVDSLVGYINGRPVFADEFLLPVEDRLLRAAEQVRGFELEQSFLIIINEWLREVVLNELILAEAEASLTEQEQMGLFAMLNQVYDEEIRKGGGTKSGAETRRRRQGDELSQYVGQQKDLVLIRHLRMAEIQPRVVVTWRDVEREYARLYEQFNPATTVTLARIRLNTSTDGQLIEEVTRRIEAGEAFSQIADDLSVDDGGLWETFETGPGGIPDIDVKPIMKDALKGLAVGDTSRPFQLVSGTLWLNVVSLNRPQVQSIYEPRVQLGLRNALHSRRSQIEWNRYIESLLEEGIHDDLDEMAERLFDIAMSRYGS